MVGDCPMSEGSSFISQIRELGFCTGEELDEVEARQVIYGGDLEVNFLELQLLSEAQLLAAISKWSGLPSADPGYLAIDEERSRGLRQAGLMALCGMDDNLEPHAFVVTPPNEVDATTIREILGDLTEIRICSRLRFNEALHFLETGSDGPRAERLLTELGARPIGDPKRESLERLKEFSPEPQSTRSDDAAPPHLAPNVAPPIPPTEASLPFAVSTPEINENDSALRPASVRLSTLGESWISLAAETGPPPDGYEEVARSATGAPTAAVVSPSPRPNYANAEAAEDLAGAKTRDRVIDILVHFAAQYFDYTAVFAVLPTEARGLRASGTGATSEVLRTLKIPLDLPSAFRDAQQSNAHRMARLRASGLEGGIARDMLRPTGKQIFLLPLTVRDRAVLLLWGDKGTFDVNLARLGDLFAVAPLVSEALERVLLERKRTSLLAQSQGSSAFPLAPKVELPREAPPPAELGYNSNTDDHKHDRDTKPTDSPFSEGENQDPSSPREEPPAEISSTSLGLMNSSPPPSTPTEEDERPTTLRGREKEKSTILSLPVPLGQAHRRPTQRNTVAPPAPQPSPLKAPRDPHEVASAEKRSLTGTKDSESHPPSAFPAELPKTLRGFPSAKIPPELGLTLDSPSVAAQTDDSALESRPPMRSIRILPVKDVAPTSRRGIEILTPTDEVAPEPPPMSGRKGQSTPRGTLMSRRAAPPEPAESGWENLEIAAVRKIETATVAQEAVSSVDSLVERFIQGDESVLGRLLDYGDTAVGSLMGYFPGPTSEPVTAQTPASACGPVLKALVALGSRVAPFLTVRTADEEPNIRRWATFVLGEIPGRDAAIAIAGRLLDSAPEVRRAALASARRAQRDGLTRRTIRAKVEGLARDRKLAVDARCSAIEALADIREHEAIPTLLQLIDDGEPSVARASRWALSVLTRQDYGKDAAAWQKFWQEHRNQDRIEWLIDSLDHEKRDLRRAAGEELRNLCGTDFGFDEESSAEDRSRIQEEFRAWWKNH